MSNLFSALDTATLALVSGGRARDSHAPTDPGEPLVDPRGRDLAFRDTYPKPKPGWDSPTVPDRPGLDVA